MGFAKGSTHPTIFVWLRTNDLIPKSALERASRRMGHGPHSSSRLHGDANMRSAWICTRNDVLGNLAVLVAALGVFGTGTGWPDTIVAAIMAMLALQGATLVIRRASTELRFGKSAAGEQPLSN